MEESDSERNGRPGILLLADGLADAELLERHLLREAAGTPWRIDDREAFLAALEQGGFALIVALYPGSGFYGLEALRAARERRPDIPFIIVSDIGGEELATDALKLGATDYILKRNLVRLPAAVARALREARERDDRHRAEAALQDSEIRLRLAVTAAQLGTWDYNPETRRVVWNARASGLRREVNVSYEKFLSRVHPEDRPALEQAVARAIAGQGSDGFVVEYRQLHPNGTLRWMSTRGQAFFANGRCVRFVGVIQDVTDRKTAESALLRLNDMLEGQVRERTRERDRIWTLSRDLLTVCDLEWKPLVLNPAWTSMLGWTEQELAAGRIINLVHPDDLRLTRAHIDALGGPAALPRFENRLRRKDGAWRWIAWTVALDQGLLYAIGRDVTEEKTAAAELEAANKRLRAQIEERERMEETLQQMQRLEAVGQLTSGVAHDFNNLLTVILGNVAFLERELPSANPKYARRLSQMGSAAQRGAQLTAQLLAFSRRQRLKPKPVNLNDTVAGMRDLLGTTMGGAVRIETVLKNGLWKALVDPTQIELIILNLAINARDAMEVGGNLTVETSNVSLNRMPSRPEEPAPGEYVMLSVTDTGTGMTDEVLAKAFEPFFTTKEVGKGSGLGLAQVYGFAKQSGGGVRIESRPGEGTTVKVYLPRASAAEKENQAGLPQSHGKGAEGQHLVLLVDDDSAVREITAAMLHDLGFHVLEAGSGGAALDMLAREPKIDLLLLDYAMPGMTGAEVAQEVRASRVDLPILFITGYADLAALKEVGEDRIVQKPFREAELAEKIAHALALAGRTNVVKLRARK